MVKKIQKVKAQKKRQQKKEQRFHQNMQRVVVNSQNLAKNKKHKGC